MYRFSVLSLLASLSLLSWLYLLLLRGMFWTCSERLEEETHERGLMPVVTAVVPARNEADVIERSVSSLMAQDFSGRFTVIVVDDESTDSTAEAARRGSAGKKNFHVVRTRPRPPGWTGKVWAMSEGLLAAESLAPSTEFILFTDADILHHRSAVRRLASKARREGLDLVSLMVLLDSRGLWAGLMIPAFVYFFQKLYPFRWAGDSARNTAAAAGGCMLVRKVTLNEAGGLARIKGAVIDDCSLAALIKKRGRIWLGLAQDEKSLRPYRGLRDIWLMVARSAYSQLNYSPLRLIATVAAMTILYIVPPFVLLLLPVHGLFRAALAGGAAWAVMTLTFIPTLRLYGKSRIAAPLLPLAGLLYTAMTVDSALRHLAGRGATWKGRKGAGNPVR